MSSAVEGRDFIALERVRLLDEMGFDQPVEAMSVLVPRVWKTQGGVRWTSPSDCRGEIVTFSMSSVSPDQSIRLDVYPARSFVWSDDRQLNLTQRSASMKGGCFVTAPFDAAQYLDKFAKTELGYALVSEVRHDATLSGDGIYATLTWPDGTRGLGNIGVSVDRTASHHTTVTSVFHQAVIRYRPEREAEALRLFGTFRASQRVNPTWQKAKDDFLTMLGTSGPRGAMERLRLTGEASAAYAAFQTADVDARMRTWEYQNAADPQPRRFIPTIREVETWKDCDGNPVELSAGYSHGWSRRDGSYILTNNAAFDPATEFKENWTRMDKVTR